MNNNADEVNTTDSGYLEAADVYANKSPLGKWNKAFEPDLLGDGDFKSIDLTDPSIVSISRDSPDQSFSNGPVNYLRMDKRSCRLPSIPAHEMNAMAMQIRPDYEELPNCIRNQDYIVGYTNIDDGSVVVGTGSFSTPRGFSIPDGKQHLVSQMKENNGRARRRSNPLYDLRGSYPGLYPPIRQSYTSNHCTCYTMQIFGFLFSVAAMVLAIISIVTQTKSASKYEELERRFSSLSYSPQNCNNSNSLPGIGDDSSLVQQLLQNNSQLQNEINSLQFKLESLQFLSNSQQILLQNLTLQIASQTNQINLLNSGGTNITNSIDTMRRDLTFQINQVPHGLVNLSLCSHQIRSSGYSAYSAQSRSESLNLNNSVVLSVVCSTDGGTQAFLEYDLNSPSVYTCVCRGQLYTNITSRICAIHSWTCPIIP